MLTPIGGVGAGQPLQIVSEPGSSMGQDSSATIPPLVHAAKRRRVADRDRMRRRRAGENEAQRETARCSATHHRLGTEEEVQTAERARTASREVMRFARAAERESQAVPRREVNQGHRRANKEGLDDAQRDQRMEDQPVRMEVTRAAEQVFNHSSRIHADRKRNQVQRETENKEDIVATRDRKKGRHCCKESHEQGEDAGGTSNRINSTVKFYRQET